ncbi:hypothetical protein [Brassicibacter mesophilus]|uniref:hypothetical protein n=1 Tax=Brassicibacter mesophilus TaxID=745119 RepID=UPI003D257D08
MYKGFFKTNYGYYENHLYNFIIDDANKPEFKEDLKIIKNNLVEIKYKFPRKIEKKNIKQLSNIDVEDFSKEQAEDYKLSTIKRLVQIDSIFNLIAMIITVGLLFTMAHVIFELEYLDDIILYFLLGASLLISSFFGYRKNRKGIYDKYFGCKINDLYLPGVIYILSFITVLYHTINYFELINTGAFFIGILITILINKIIKKEDAYIDMIESNLRTLESLEFKNEIIVSKIESVKITNINDFRSERVDRRRRDINR